ncbi:hypothetical protein [Pseudodesulfovibrio sediminis]|uniref:Uncharacterized protein n=1 Tax=Pseudodesulfovibrio sediminis TaxID=2810563 RepID=A0ABN6EQ43_9BACT|nr:hypothetical protein [Pseudodesulfovibrio sediminis]BCS87191.1 hypothetical protein PSDVSF_04330 [Pseudodesulfovibrio sediminis]
MRSYLIEDLVEDDYKKVMKSFDELGFRGPIDDIYYLPMPEELLQREQQEHMDECGPYFMALECIAGTEESSLKLELLVRGRNRMRCSCVTYATSEQRKHMIEYLDQFIEELEISV